MIELSVLHVGNCSEDTCPVYIVMRLNIHIMNSFPLNFIPFIILIFNLENAFRGQLALENRTVVYFDILVIPDSFSSNDNFSVRLSILSLYCKMFS